MTAYPLQAELAGRLDRPQVGCPAVDNAARTQLQAMWPDVVGELGRLAAAMGVPADRREDLLQEVFLTAWKKPPACTDRRQLKWWLIRVTTNRCNLLHRRRTRWRRMWLQAALIKQGRTSKNDQPHPSAAQEQKETISQALSRLPDQQRTVLVLRYFEDYDSKQIGRILELPDSTVRSHLRKARLALAEKLIESGYEHDE